MKKLSLTTNISVITVALLLSGGCSNKANAKQRKYSYSQLKKQNFKKSGVASYYAKRFHGRKTANGERFDMYAMTAAHKTLKFGTHLKVTNRANGKSVVVRINDRGPYVGSRIIDLSYQAAKKIGMLRSGTAKVKLEVVKR